MRKLEEADELVVLHFPQQLVGLQGGGHGGCSICNFVDGGEKLWVARALTIVGASALCRRSIDIGCAVTLRTKFSCVKVKLKSAFWRTSIHAGLLELVGPAVELLQTCWEQLSLG